MLGLAVVKCLEIQKLEITLASVVTVYTFADVVDVAGYDARGMFDDFFPRYPYKTTRNSWKYFLTWVTEGTGSLYQEFCLEWIALAQKFLRDCPACRFRSRKPTYAEVERIFGSWRPYYIGERPRYMYKDDDKLVQESELYPVAGGLVMEEAGPGIKAEEMDAPPGFLWPLTHFEIGGPSGVLDDQTQGAQLEKQLVSVSEAAPAEATEGEKPREDPMLCDPAVLLMLAGLSGFSK